MHKPETVLENKTRRILWNFDIQTVPIILDKTLDL